MPSINPSDYAAIKNTIARYAVALDTKNFELFHRVFAPTVRAEYPFSPEPLGFHDLAEKIKSRLGPLKTHHALSTHLIEPTIPSRDNSSPPTPTVSAVTFLTGTHFHETDRSKDYTVWGRYVDTLVLVPADGGDGDGADNVGENSRGDAQWLISHRRVEFVGRKDGV